MATEHHDWVIVGSGFGGSVSAYRLSLWNPALGFQGIFQMTFLKHLTVFHGVGVGGGSLVYANTLPTPEPDFFSSPSWSHLRDWEKELAPHYATAKRMLGATRCPVTTRGDEALRQIASGIGREAHFHPSEVGVFFGEPNRKVPDPYSAWRAFHGPHLGWCADGGLIGNRRHQRPTRGVPLSRALRG